MSICTCNPPWTTLIWPVPWGKVSKYGLAIHCLGLGHADGYIHPHTL
jgi:hypothetical protein